MSQTGSTNEALYTVITLLPSVSGGFIIEKGREVGIYVTITEEVIRGCTGPKNKKCRYYEWVAPAFAGDETRRTRSYYLSIGCSIVIPSTFVVRLGSNQRQEVVVFAHTVRVRLPEQDDMVFMTRPSSYIMTDLEEYHNRTEFLCTDYLYTAEIIQPDQFSVSQRIRAECVVGTIPTISNIAVNTPGRENIVHTATNLALGPSGVMEAYKRTPIYKLRSPGSRKTVGAMQVEGVRLIQEGWNDEYILKNVPYSYFEFISGKPLTFPLSLAQIWELELKKRVLSMEKNIMSESDSDSSGTSSASDGTASSCQDEPLTRRSPRFESQ